MCPGSEELGVPSPSCLLRAGPQLQRLCPAVLGWHGVHGVGAGPPHEVGSENRETWGRTVGESSVACGVHRGTASLRSAAGKTLRGKAGRSG